MILIGIGSNLGDSAWQVKNAIRHLGALFETQIVQSRLWCSRPIDCPADAPDFINAVISFRIPPSLAPMELLKILKQLELAAGRLPAERKNVPRALDLDLLAFGDTVIRSSLLTLPHPRAIQRHFVLVPAAEIAPDFVWPGAGNKTIRTLMAALPALDWGEPVA